MTFPTLIAIDQANFGTTVREIKFQTAIEMGIYFPSVCSLKINYSAKWGPNRLLLSFLSFTITTDLSAMSPVLSLVNTSHFIDEATGASRYRTRGGIRSPRFYSGQRH